MTSSETPHSAPPIDDVRAVFRMLWEVMVVMRTGAGHPAPTFADFGHLSDEHKAVLVWVLPTPDEEAEQLVREEVSEHVSEIMFTSHERPDPNCTLCKKGIELGIWSYYGVDDPFAPEDDE